MPKIQFTGAPVSKDGSGFQHELPFKVLRSDLTGNDGSGTIRRLSDLTIALL
jgi:hypothetical protein